MKRFFFVIPILVALAGCAQPLPASAYKPANPEFYADLPEQYFLKGKIGVGQVSNNYAKNDIITGEAYGEALKNILDQAGVLAKDNAPYTLNADIVDYRWPSTGFTHITSGTAVNYRLIDAQSGQSVFETTITATQEEKKFFLQEAAPVMIHALAIAFGENAAQATRELASLKAADVGVKTITSPVKNKNAKTPSKGEKL